MFKRLLLAALLLAAIPRAGGTSSAKACQQWNAWSPAQHHKAGPADVVGGHAYGSGYHSDAYESPPKGPGAYGDPQRQAAEGGYVSVKSGKLYAQVNFFGPSDENDTTHLYDTVGGACVSYNTTGFNVEQCVPTSKVLKPKAWGPWTPCDGY